MDKKPSQKLFNSPAGLRFLTEALRGKPSEKTAEAFRKTAKALRKSEAKAKDSRPLK